jgi:hypothetical protein
MGTAFMRHATLSGLLTLCCVLAACGQQSDHIIIAGRSGVVNIPLGLDDGHVTLHAQDAPDATISANGELQIDQQPVTTSAGERELLKSYYENAMKIRTDAIATGKAGAAVGAQALKSVANRLASGDPDQIKQDVNAKTQIVKASVLKLCQDIGNTKTAQDQLSTQLSAFKPYANIISADDVNDCEKDQQS